MVTSCCQSTIFVRNPLISASVLTMPGGKGILLSEIWGTDFVGETRTVDVHIGTLRTKLAEAGELIQTVRGVGYKMEENNEQ